MSSFEKEIEKNRMVEADIIHFQQALFLKKLGVPQDSFKRYVLCDYGNYPNSHSKGDIVNLNSFSSDPLEFINQRTACIYTHDVIKKWFRDKWGIVICVSYYQTNREKPWGVYVYSANNNFDSVQCNVTFCSYENATSVGIDRAIEILTVIKEIERKEREERERIKNAEKDNQKDENVVTFSKISEQVVNNTQNS